VLASVAVLVVEQQGMGHGERRLAADVALALAAADRTLRVLETRLGRCVRFGGA
jgi:hypothetical protein